MNIVLMFDNGTFVFTDRFTQHDLCRMLPFAILRVVQVRRRAGVFKKYYKCINNANTNPVG